MQSTNQQKSQRSAIGTIIEQIGKNAGNVIAAAKTRMESVFEMLGVVEHAQTGIAEMKGALDQLSAYFVSTAGRITGLGNARDRLSKSLGGMRAGLTDMRQDTNDFDAAFRVVEGHAKAVSDIARMARLLALNASVEAARAGEAGLGFAVVAQEMQLMSEQSNQRADQINREIARLGEVLEMLSSRVVASESALVEMEEATKDIGKELVAGQGEAEEMAGVANKTLSMLTSEVSALSNVLTSLRAIETDDRTVSENAGKNMDLVREAMALTNARD